MITQVEWHRDNNIYTVYFWHKHKKEPKIFTNRRVKPFLRVIDKCFKLSESDKGEFISIDDGWVFTLYD